MAFSAEHHNDFSSLNAHHRAIAAAPAPSMRSSNRYAGLPGANRMDPRDNARNPVQGKTHAVKAPLDGGGFTMVQARSNRPEDINKAFLEKQKLDPTLKDRRVKLENRDREAKFEGGAAVITGVAPKEVKNMDGLVLANVAGHTSLTNKDTTNTTFNNARLSVTAGNSNVAGWNVGATTIMSLKGDSVKVGGNTHVAQVEATNANRPHRPHGEVPSGSIRARKREDELPAPGFI